MGHNATWCFNTSWTLQGLCLRRVNQVMTFIYIYILKGEHPLIKVKYFSINVKPGGHTHLNRISSKTSMCSIPLHPPLGVFVQSSGRAVRPARRSQTAASPCQSATDSGRSCHSGTAPTPLWHGQSSCSTIRTHTHTHKACCSLT